MEAAYQADDHFFEFFKGQVKELYLERSQSIITSVFLALTGSRHKTRRRKVNSIPPMPLTTGSTTPATIAYTQTTTTPPFQDDTTLEPLMPVPVAEVPIQPPMVESQLGGHTLQTHKYTMMVVMFPFVA